MKINIRIFKSNKGVSEALGTILLLGIAVAIFSVLYFIVLSESFETDEPYPTVVAFVEGDNIIIEHRGGDEIDVGSEFSFELNGVIKTIIVDEAAIDDQFSKSPDDGMWGAGERLVFELTSIHGGSDPYDPSNTDIDIFGSQEIENGDRSIITGNLDIHPTSDIGIKCTVSNEIPVIGSIIDIKITVTHYRGDMVIPAGLTINFILPEGLEHNSSNTNSGNYNNETGIWTLDELGFRSSATLTITAKVVAKGTLAEYTQLVLLLDGSGSISGTDWNIMRNGIGLAIEDGFIPHNEMVELTIIQFGGWTGGNPGFSGGRSWARVELGGPIILNLTNYNDVANQIELIGQLGGGTAMSCSFRLAADIISGDLNNYLLGTSFEGMDSTNSDWPRQVVNLVTDGQPNMIYIHDERYAGYWPTNNDTEQYNLGKTNTETALDYYLSIIPINEDENDEIDAVAVGDDTDIPWLRDFIVRPQPGYDTWPPAGPGWVRYVSDYTEFANTINEQFELIFSGINLKADMDPLSSSVDITVKVNVDKTIHPEESP